jgi:single-strand DNA-binding protein
MNVVVLRGQLSSEPRQRVLPSGTVLVNWELTTDHEDTKLTVPIAWFDPPKTASAVSSGDQVVVIGSVRRRFYRAGGTTVSSTEVVGERMAPAGRSRSVVRLSDVAIDRVQVLSMSP